MSDLSIARDMRRQLAEKAFEETLKAYALDTGHNRFGDGRKFQFGGAYNLISSVKILFEKLAEETGCEDYAKVIANDARNIAEAAASVRAMLAEGGK